MFRNHGMTLSRFLSGAKGFTLIELLVVIAIVAVLAVVVILTLNPAELLRQARDSNRISDLGTMKSVLSIYLADVNVTGTSPLGTWPKVYTNSNGNSAYTAYMYSATNTLNTGAYLSSTANAAGATTQVASTSQRNVDGSGWIPVNFNAISSGSPTGNLPIDPLNTGSNTYAYAASSTVFKFTAQMESAKYSVGGGSDVESNDGGISTSTFETGTKLAL